jgi:hypothetical protein
MDGDVMKDWQRKACQIVKHRMHVLTQILEFRDACREN